MSIIKNFHEAFKKCIDKKYKRFVFEETFIPYTDLDSFFVDGSVVIYTIDDDLDSDMLKHMLDFCKKQQVSFTINIDNKLYFFISQFLNTESK